VQTGVDEDDKESTGTRFGKHEVEEAAEIVGYGAVKYADLKSNRQTDYIFSYDRMLATRGNTAVYLEYAHARMSSVSRKAGLDMEALKKTAIVELDLPSETELAIQLLRFPDVITMTVNGLLPHRLCEYLYDIATKFSAFWRDCKVIGDPRQDSRLLLCDAAALILRTGLKLLGIKAVFKL
jgi:arginyl-tRNA synthetase